MIVISAFKPQSWSEGTTGAEERWFWLNKTFAPPEYDLVILGDSRIYRGVSPEAIESTLPGTKALNFGFSGAGYYGEYLIEAKSKLSPDANPPILLLGITPHSLTPNGAINEHFTQETNRPPIYQIMYTRLPKLMDLLDPIDPALVFIDFASLTNLVDLPGEDIWSYNQVFNQSGWISSSRFPVQPDYALKTYKEIFLNNHVDEFVVNSLLWSIDNWVENGILVFGFRMPTTAEMIRLEDEMSGFDEQEFVSRFEQAGGHWLTICGDCYASYDGSHLLAEEAIQLSMELGRLMLEQK